MDSILLICKSFHFKTKKISDVLKIDFKLKVGSEGTLPT